MTRQAAIVVTRRFERALEVMLDYYETMQHMHPDAGSRILKLLDSVENELPVLLAEQPGIGRPAQLNLRQSAEESAWLQRMASQTATRRLQPREWLIGDFWILYYRSAKAVYLASARHVREAGYW